MGQRLGLRPVSRCQDLRMKWGLADISPATLTGSIMI